MNAKIPSYRLHKPSGRAVVTLCGRDHYLGPWNSPESREAYARLLAEWTSRSQAPVASKTSASISVVELLAAYLEFAREYYSRDGKPTAEFIALRYIIKQVRQLYGRTPVSEFGPIALKAIRQAMLDSDLCRPEINKRILRVRRIFRWGVENELVPPTVLEGLRAVAPLKRGRSSAREPRKVIAVPMEHVTPVLGLVAPQVATMIQLQLLSGMRSGEVVIMRPCDIDQSQNVWIYRPTNHKTDYLDIQREIYLGPQAQALLRPWLQRNASTFCFSPIEAEEARNGIRRQNRCSPMTPSQRQRKAKPQSKRAKRIRYDRDSYRRAIEYGIRKSGVPHWHPHQLRHACATKVRSLYGLDAAQLITGHQSANITEVYAEVDRTKALLVAAQVG